MGRAVAAGYYRVGADRIADSIIRKLAVRRTRVSALRSKVIAGIYEIDAERVADAVVGRIDDRAGSAAAYARAIELTTNPVQRAFLERRSAGLVDE